MFESLISITTSIQLVLKHVLFLLSFTLTDGNPLPVWFELLTFYYCSCLLFSYDYRPGLQVYCYYVTHYWNRILKGNIMMKKLTPFDLKLALLKWFFVLFLTHNSSPGGINYENVRVDQIKKQSKVHTKNLKKRFCAYLVQILH